MVPTDRNCLLNRSCSLRDPIRTRHFELSLQESGLSYEPGDSLGVIPHNNPTYVDELLNAVGLTGNEIVQVGENSTSSERCPDQ